MENSELQNAESFQTADCDSWTSRHGSDNRLGPLWSSATTSRENRNSNNASVINGVRQRSNEINGEGGSEIKESISVRNIGAEDNVRFNKNQINYRDIYDKNRLGESRSGRGLFLKGSGSEVDEIKKADSIKYRFPYTVSLPEDIYPWSWIRRKFGKVSSTRRRLVEPVSSDIGRVENRSLKMSRPPTPITAFFKNRSVFVTGATGFLGKAAVEKLLRTCSDVQTVYILIRPKSGSDVQARLDELLENSLYDTLRQKDPEVLKKIVPISGDITLPYLGISEEDQEILASEVSVVIHSAATVKFDEKLKLSVNVNVQGTKRMVELCKRMSKLAVLVHVSTAYANCERKEIDEIVYPPPADPNKLIQCMEWMDDDIVETITPQLIGDKPNTYTYTKALAEHILTVEAEDLPVCIVRPSIVTATWKEPVAGWVDNVNGPTGLIAACGKGVLRTLLCYRNNVADLVPLDFPVNLILSAAWYTAEHKPEGIKVYNCCTGTQNPLLWGELESWGFKHLVKNPLSDVLWYPAGSFKSNRFWNNINDFFIHYVPAYMMDVVARLTGRKPIMLKVYKKIAKALQSLEYFTINEWNFNTNNMVTLFETLSPEDQETFSFNVKEVNWPAYIGKYCLGLRKYVMKEDHSTLPAARKHVRKLYWVHKFTQFFLILIFWRAIMFRCETARQLWKFLFAMIIRISRMVPIGKFS